MQDRWVFTFDTTHHALWAEELAAEAGIAALTVPAPAAARARCGLALEVDARDYARLGEVLRATEIAFAAEPVE